MILLASRNKESSKPENDVIEEVVKQDVVLNLLWTLAQVLIIYLHGVQSVLCPEVREVAIDLVDENWRKRLARESSQEQRPVVEVRSIAVITHTLVIILDDLYEGSHDLRETNNSNKHVANSDKYFVY